MEDFVDALVDGDFKKEIFKRLSNYKPFRNFKDLIDSSEYRLSWFDFKEQVYIEWIKEQIDAKN